MNKLIFIFTGIFCLNIFVARADEGMWPISMLNEKNLREMQSLGCKLSIEQIASFNQSSLKDAIVQFGGGCTGEIVSSEGLLFTNHHCGYSWVQSLSSPEHDYLKDGFWAYSIKEELPNPGLSVWFLNHVEDITETILANISDTTNETKRLDIIRENRVEYLKKAKENNNNNTTIEIVEFYHGNQYLKFEYIIYTDVRLVGVPPSSIGKFGGDTDNWEWPRQTGDFSIFRVYTAPDGSPADYSAENIPLKPKYFLPVSLKGVKQNDFAMVMGYPGSTDRYAPSKRIESIVNDQDPAIVACRTVKLAAYKKHMNASPEIYLKYANKQASVANYWKNAIGQIKQIKNNKVIENRRVLEQQFSTWVNEDKSRKEKYGSLLTNYIDDYDVIGKYLCALIYGSEAGIRGGEALTLAYRLFTANQLIENKDLEKFESNKHSYQKRIKDAFKDYDIATDRDVTIAMLNLYYKNIPAKYQPKLLKEIGDKQGGDFTSFVDKAFKKSLFVSEERMNTWLKKPVSLKKDPLMQMMQSIIANNHQLSDSLSAAMKDINRCDRLFITGLMEMQPDKNFYSDANFTMRVSYGNVQPYNPRDAVEYDYITTLEGVMEKEIPGDSEFDVDPKLKSLFDKKDYGQYADMNGKLVVNFLTTNDITGGNSGSPVIDAEGNLIGLAFDGNWEAMSGDIAFEKALQRTICCDVRYVLFVIDKLADAKNIINELKIVK